MNLAIFASGNGSNFQAIADSINNGFLKEAQIKILIVDHKDAYAIKRAEKLSIPYKIFELKQFRDKAEYEKAILEVLEENKIELICLAGYMKIVSETLLNVYEGRIINIHPALLPSFKGAHGILDAYNYGCKVFGVTIHYVSKELDGGKIISQRAFEYYGNDIEELERKIHEVEHILYPETIKKIIMEEKEK